MNNVLLVGTVAQNPTFSHKCYNTTFYQFSLEIARASGNVDTLQCICNEELSKFVVAGERIRIDGEIRTKNFHDTGKSKLAVFVFCKEIEETKDADTNIVELCGYVCKEPRYRVTLTSQRELCDLMIASQRVQSNYKNDYIPTLAWGRGAKYSSNLAVGTGVVVLGRLQSREYKKALEDGTIENRTTYEVSAGRIQEGVEHGRKDS